MITDKQTGYIIKYPQAIEFAEQQASIFWTPEEIDVEKDIQDMRVNLTEAEYHGVVTTLKLFTLYELQAGNEYWGGRVKRLFPRPDIQRMASTFSYTELGIHAPFYNKINEALMLDNEEFYNSYLENDVLRSRMEHIESIVSNPDTLVSLGAFSLVEGAVLYSNFAFLKHFQANGKNKLVNLNRGIDFSVRDENIHSLAGAWLYNEVKSDYIRSTPHGNDSYFNIVEDQILQAADSLYRHEAKICEMIFEKGDISGINLVDMKTFVKSRINLVLQNLGIDVLFTIESNPIADWFYNDINQLKFGDFFTGTLSEYNRDWNEDSFTW